MEPTKTRTYKDFIIENNCTRQGGRQWTIYNLNGQWLRNCKTLKECIRRIDNQEV